MFKKGLLIILLLALSVGVVSAADANGTCDADVAVINDNDEVMANDVNGDNNVVGQEDNVSVVGEDTDENSDIVIDAKPASFNDDVEEVSYSFKVYSRSSGLALNGYEFSFSSDPNSYDIGGWSDDYGICRVSFAPSFISGGSALINVWGDDGSYNYRIVNIKINHITKLSNTNPPNNKLTVSAPGVKVTVKSKNYFKVTVKKGNSPVKGLKLKIKVWTAKKVKTYTIRTNNAGVAKLSTKSLKVGKHKVKVISKKKGYKFTKASKIVVKKRSNVKSATMRIYDSYHYYATKKLKTGDYLHGFYESEHGRQSSPGIYIGTRMDPGQELQHSTRLIKAKIFYHRVIDGKVVSKIVKPAKNKYNIRPVKWDDSIVPFKVTVWYKKR